MSQQDPVVGITMGSDSDLPVMGAAADVLEAFGVPHEVRVVSAHRTPQVLADYGTTCLLYTSPSPRDGLLSRMPSSA